MERKGFFFKYFFSGFLLVKKKWVGRQKDMLYKLVSKTDVMSSSGVMYLSVSKIFYKTRKPSASKIFSIN